MSHSLRKSMLRAFNLEERQILMADQALTSAPVSDMQRAERRLERWKSAPAFAQRPDLLKRRLAHNALDEAGLREMLISQPVEGANLLSMDWLAATSNIDLSYDDPANEYPGFLRLAEPVLGPVRADLRQTLAALPNMNALGAVHAIERMLFVGYAGTLNALMSKTLILELNVARVQGTLTSNTPELRFREFLQTLAQPHIREAIFNEYPVLLRTISDSARRWLGISKEFMGRLCVDLPDLQRTLLGHEHGVITALSMGAGDTHKGGRSVALLTFTSGRRLVYKPRSLKIDVHFQELLEWINKRGFEPAFRVTQLLPRSAYGWCEFIEKQACANIDEVGRFFQRQGGYVALLYALEATDFHFENLIASGEHPILIDLEALFHPRRAEVLESGMADKLAGHEMAFSVLRIGLLPQRMWNRLQDDAVDLSGLSGRGGQLTPMAVPQIEGNGTDAMRIVHKRAEMTGGDNLPMLENKELDVSGFARELQQGFALAYQILLEHRDALLAKDGPIEHCAGDDVRVIVRPTRTYALIHGGSTHPDYQRDALDRDRFLDALWVEVGRDDSLERLVDAERADLLEGDIPLFSTHPGSRDVWDARGNRIPGFYERSGLELVRARLQRLSKSDFERQAWLVKGSLATLEMGLGRSTWHSAPRQFSEEKATRTDLMQRALAVGERLDKLAFHAGDESTWQGLTFIDEKNWALLPMGIDLYSGLAGVAYFLAYLGQISGQMRHSDLARRSWRTVTRVVDGVLEHAVGVGAFTDISGLAHVAAHLGHLWNDDAQLLLAERMMRRAGELIAQDQALDVIGGAAGCIASALSVHAVTGSQSMREVVERAGAHLAQHAQRQPDGSLAWGTPMATQKPLLGFSHGASGMAWALARAAKLCKRPDWLQVSNAALAYERAQYSSQLGNWPDFRDVNGPGDAGHMLAWCHGAPGVGLARLGLLETCDSPELRSDIAQALRITRKQGFGLNHSLCHGDLGNLELWTEAARTLSDSTCTAESLSLAHGITRSMDAEGLLCGVPLGTETPGLMSGISGIGLGLLRMAAPDHVPSILLLQSPLTTGPTVRHESSAQEARMT